MRFIIMCGGNGSRLKHYSLPKPLNFIEGKPAIEKVLQHLPIDEFHFVVSPALQEYQFESFIRSSFRGKTCHFHHIPYITRGAVESAWLGTLEFLDDGEPIVFLDNDILYSCPPSLIQPKMNAFLGFSEDYTSSEAFSFITVDDSGFVQDIQEKKRISNHFVCGVYGFSCLTQFRAYAKELLQCIQETELYMSCLYRNMLRDKQDIETVFFPPPIRHLGSRQEISTFLSSQKDVSDLTPSGTLRICFDLDHTLVTSPTNDWDYSTVEPIPKMIKFAQEMSDKGHTIIIYTARRMKTKHHNVGAVVKDCGQEVFRTLERFSIPYDELIFGKPIADVYIDDKAFNPYLNSLSAFGFFSEAEKNIPFNSLQPNRYHQLTVEEGVVVKRGLEESLEGEAYYYRINGSHPKLNKFMPRYISYQVNGKNAELRMEHLKGIPFAYLYQMELLTPELLSRLFQQVDELHQAEGRGNVPSLISVKNNYTEKMKKRLSLIKTTCSIHFNKLEIEQMEKFCFSTLTAYITDLKETQLVNHIHGDLWFSNILLTFDNQIKWFDMRGSCDKQLTTGGDPIYDFAKLYQSFIGYVLVLLGKEPTDYHRKHLEFYHNFLHQRGISIPTVRDISICLMVGSVPFLEDDEIIRKMWKWLNSLVNNH